MEIATCPKRMEYGPCGGVATDGSCEVADHPCVFIHVQTVRWAGIDQADAEGVSTPVRRVGVVQGAGSTAGAPEAPVSAADRMRARLATTPIVVADFPARALSAESIRSCAGILAGQVDAVLAGDSGRSRVQFSPSYRAHLIRAAGLDVWAGINCRDRNRVAIAGELAGLADVGVVGVHCVTGDHTKTGTRPDAMPVFDLDSTETASLAAANGHLVSVAEAPLAPPVERRVGRLVEKVRAGAEICFVNHAGGIGPVAAFIARAREHGLEIGFVVCVPVVLDLPSAAMLASFPGLVIPTGYLDAILAADDIRAAGMAAAVDLGRRFLDVDGVVGVNLSGGGAVGDESAFAEGLAAVGARMTR